MCGTFPELLSGMKSFKGNLGNRFAEAVLHDSLFRLKQLHMSFVIETLSLFNVSFHFILASLQDAHVCEGICGYIRDSIVHCYYKMVIST